MTKKRSIRNVPNVLEDDLLSKIKAVPDLQLKSYFAFLYLFGSRVSEAIGLPLYDKVGEYKYVRKSRNGTKTVTVDKLILHKDADGNKVWVVEPIKAWQVEYDHIAKILYVRNIPTLKQTNRPGRDTWVLIKGPGEYEIAKILYDYVKKMREFDEMGPLFDLTRNQVYKATRKYLGANAFPHKLRDLRATKDATVYGLDVKDLQEKYNWSRPDMAMYYGRKNRTDIIQKMQRQASLYQDKPNN